MPWGRVPASGILAVRANGTVHVVHVVLTPANVGSAGLQVTPSVRELVALQLAVCRY